MMERVLSVNYEKCCGCEYCMLICSMVHENTVKMSKSRIKIYRNEDEAMSVPVVCEHCIDPPCIPACPLGAITKSPESGIVKVNGEQCTGCQSCIAACPYSAIRIDPEKNEVFLCDLCEGDPKCAKGCMPNAIEWLENKPSVLWKKEVNAKKRNIMLKSVLEV